MPDLPEAPRVPTTARHYAEAIFELAKEEGSFTPWSERLVRLRHLLEDSELGHAVASPQFSSSQQAELAKAVVSREKEIDRAGENLVLLLIQSRRTAILAAIEAGFALTNAIELLATAHVENPASRRVLDKCGFTHTGTGLEGAPARGGMVPCDRFALARAVWAARRAPPAPGASLGTAATP